MRRSRGHTWAQQGPVSRSGGPKCAAGGVRSAVGGAQCAARVARGAAEGARGAAGVTGDTGELREPFGGQGVDGGGRVAVTPSPRPCV